MELQYFGTDGIRGRALASPLTLTEVSHWGRSWANLASSRGIKEFVIGWDPRLSSESLVKAFLSGVGESIRTCIVGLAPTPTVAYITANRPLAWGIVFSASHNPPDDNGIKSFDNCGEKTSQEDEFALETAFKNMHTTSTADSTKIDLTIKNKLIDTYISHLSGIDIPDDIVVVIDCANGATAPWAPLLLRGKSIHWIGVPANGAKINLGTGSSNIDCLASKVRELKADIGIAFDGDGDRCLMVDQNGDLVDGDQLIWLISQELHKAKKLINGVVGTIMSNSGLEEALLGLGVPFVRTAVGDKHMLRELNRLGWQLAAEASGHVIQKQISPSGDGLATAITAVRALIGYNVLDRWSWRFKPWHMRMVNLNTTNHKPIESCKNILTATKNIRSTYGNNVRTVIRWSGTESKLRLMAETKSEALTNEILSILEHAARTDLVVNSDA
jgi:phosphoglucosamine mutase